MVLINKTNYIFCAVEVSVTECHAQQIIQWVLTDPNRTVGNMILTPPVKNKLISPSQVAASREYSLGRSDSNCCCSIECCFGVGETLF